MNFLGENFFEKKFSPNPFQKTFQLGKVNYSLCRADKKTVGYCFLRFLFLLFLLFVCGTGADGVLFRAFSGVRAADAGLSAFFCPIQIEDNPARDGKQNQKNEDINHILFLFFHKNRFRKLPVDVVASILDGDRTVASPLGNHRDGFAAVASQRKQKRIQFFVIGFDLADNVFLSFFDFSQIHSNHRSIVLRGFCTFLSISRC